MKTETYRAALWHRKQNRKDTNAISLSNKKNNTLSSDESIYVFPQKRKQAPVTRALPCVFQKGSLVVEAAMVLPLFLLALLTIAGMLQIYSRQLTMTEKLLETAEKTAVYRASTASAETADIPLVKSESFIPGVHLFGLGKCRLTAVVRVRAWIGYTGDLGGEDISLEDTELVYISDNREAYHTSPECSYLDINLTAMEKKQAAGVRNELGERYTACDKCCRGMGSGTVYVSGRGSHYHSTVSCSGLSRSPTMVSRKEAGHLPLCTRCRKREGTA